MTAVPMTAPWWCAAEEQARGGRKGKMDERQEAAGDFDVEPDPLSGPVERAAGLLVLRLLPCVWFASARAVPLLTRGGPGRAPRLPSHLPAASTSLCPDHWVCARCACVGAPGGGAGVGCVFSDHVPVSAGR